MISPRCFSAKSQLSHSELRTSCVFVIIWFSQRVRKKDFVRKCMCDPSFSRAISLFMKGSPFDIWYVVFTYCICHVNVDSNRQLLLWRQTLTNTSLYDVEAH